MPISTQSAKAKGRRLQQTVRDAILQLFPDLEPDDVRSCAMGSGGEDVQMSPAARRLFPYSVECKARASWSALEWVDQATFHSSRCDRAVEPIVVVKADRRQPYVIISLEAFMALQVRRP